VLPGAHEEAPGSSFETLPRAAHFPHLEDPDGLAAALAEFMQSTEPGRIDDADWGSVIASRLTAARAGSNAVSR